MFKVKRAFKESGKDKFYAVDSTFESEDQGKIKRLLKAGILENTGVQEQEDGEQSSSILNGNVAEIKEAITSEAKREELEELKRQEIKGQNRKGVLEHIETIILEKEEE
ncbi:hypothetical protein [Oceanobacillus salinisoli]|uniref:hypothetical protein n=1 Tax=Oceanobacillus salinisoli TaxID=2678611 RepID=UPI0012E27475|nr:hypothetical protein [Oceanobacillus salinisoli]